MAKQLNKTGSPDGRKTSGGRGIKGLAGWIGGATPMIGIPVFRSVRFINLHSWTICLILLLLYLAVLVASTPGTLSGRLAAMWDKVKTDRVHRILLSILIGCFLGTGITKWIERQEDKKQREMVYQQFYNERIYIRLGTMGMAEIKQGRYDLAIDSLRKYADTSAVAAYYYGLALYNGYAIEADPVAGFKYLELSAEQNYYRAVYELFSHYLKVGNTAMATEYAKKYVAYYIPRFVVFQEETFNDHTSGPFFDYEHRENRCYEYLSVYFSYISHDLAEGRLWIRTHWRNYGNDGFFKEYEKRDEAKLYYATGHKRTARRKMGRVVRKYPNSAGAKLEYAKILLDVPNEECDISIDNISLKKIQRAEKNLLESIKITELRNCQKLVCIMPCYIANDLGKIMQEVTVTMYMNESDNPLETELEGVTLLEKLYRKTGYEKKACDMNHLLSDIKMHRIYEKLGE